LGGLGRPAGQGRGRTGRLGREGLPGRKVGRAEAKKKNFRIKIGFLNLARLWKIVEEDLGGILTWGFFLNSSRLFKDFRKI
jgi:hypothetical protein